MVFSLQTIVTTYTFVLSNSNSCLSVCWASLLPCLISWFFVLSIIVLFLPADRFLGRFIHYVFSRCDYLTDKDQFHKVIYVKRQQLLVIGQMKYSGLISLKMFGWSLELWSCVRLNLMKTTEHASWSRTEVNIAYGYSKEKIFTLLSWRPCFWSNMTSSITQNSNVVNRRLHTTQSAYYISDAYGIQM